MAKYKKYKSFSIIIARWPLVAALVLTGLMGCGKSDKQGVGLRSEINANDTLQLQSLEGTGIYADGWVGNEASISLANPKHTQVLSIAGINVQTGMKDESLHLIFEYAKDAKDSIEIGQMGSFNEIVLLPPVIAAKDTLQFRITSSKVFVPSKLGTSQDDRLLSFRLVKIALLDPAGLEKIMPEAFEFPAKEESNSNITGIFQDGWISDSAVVTLHNLKGKITVEIQGFVPGDIFPKIANLEICANGHLLVKEQLAKKTGGFFRSLIQLPDELADLSKVTLILKPSGTFVPAERGINSDRRRLSYRLQYVGLR
jgi:hypothetical protein